MHGGIHHSVGDFDGEAVNGNGIQLIAFMSLFGMAAFKSFFHAGPTWCSAAGLWHRIDYVCVDAADFLTCSKRGALMTSTVHSLLGKIIALCLQISSSFPRALACRVRDGSL